MRFAVWLAGSVLALATAGAAALEGPPAAPGPRPGFSLDLARELPDGRPDRHLGLGLVASGSDPQPPATSDHDEVRLDLVARPERARFSDLTRLEEELRVLRWPDGVGTLERHLGDELGRILDGASPGSVSSPAMVFDVLEVGRAIGRTWRRWRSRRRPVSSAVPADGVARVLVRDVDGQVPAAVWVVPVGAGGGHDAIEAACDTAGRCLVEGLPAGTQQLLVRGIGEAVVDLEPATGTAVVRLSAIAAR